MDRKENLKVKTNVFDEIMFRLKENVILILIVVLLAGAFGFAYHKLKKPVYTASEMVNYMAYYDDLRDDPTAANAMNLMSVYVHTMVDFCTSGVVLDRAEYYYAQYLNSDKDLDTFVEELKDIDNSNAVSTYDPSKITKRVYFNENNVSSSLLTHGDDTEESYIFVLSTNNLDPAKAVEMVRIFAVAVDHEGRDYFEGVDTYVYELVKDSEGVAVSKAGSLTKSVAIFVVLGAVLAGLIIYVKTLLDKTVKDKEEIEDLTGVTVLAYIEKQENYNGK